MVNNNTFAEILKERSTYYEKLSGEDNIAHEDLVCFMNECLKLEEFNIPFDKDDDESANIIISRLYIDSIDDRVNIMANLIEGWQNLNVTTNPQRTMFSRWFALMIVSAFIDVITEYKNREDKVNKYASLFMPRDLFFEKAVECKIPLGECHNIFEAIEGSLGYNGPLKLKPVSETPGYVYALAKYIEIQQDLTQDPFEE